MELRKIEINDKVYLFINESKGTRNGFKEETKVFCNNIYLTEATCYYLNRSWQMYTYQSVMKKAIREIIENINNDFIEYYKNKNNISKLTKKRKESNEFLQEKNDYLQNKTSYGDYIRILEELENRG